MSLATATASLPDDSYASESAVSNDRIARMSEPRVLFFAGDDILPNEKHYTPEWKGFGGIFLPNVRTLKQTPNKGMLYRCKFTRLTMKYIDEPKDMLLPNDRQNWQGEFTRTVKNVNGQEEQVVTKGFTNWQLTQEEDPHERTFDRKLVSTHTVYKQRYPDEDVREALKVNPPNGTRGVVEIAALRNASLGEISEAQHFFFPQWKEIQMGALALPNTIRELENHITSRINAIQSQDWDLAKKNKYVMIGNDMLKSCTEFTIGGTDYLKSLEDSANEAKYTGRPYVYPVKGILFSEQLEIKRKDDLISGDSSAVDRLARTMEANTGQDRDLRERELAIRERELALKEAELNIAPKAQEPISTAPAVAPAIEPIVEPDPEPEAPEQPVGLPEDEPTETSEVNFVCGRPTAKGTCERVVKAEGEACWGHE